MKMVLHWSEWLPQAAAYEYWDASVRRSPGWASAHFSATQRAQAWDWFDARREQWQGA